MREGYCSRFCLCVCYRAYCYIPRLYFKSRVPLGFLCCSQCICCVDFVENALFKSSGQICWSPLPSSLLDELLMDKRNSYGFFSRRLVCRTSDSSYNSTDSSYQEHFLACFLWKCKTADQACAWSCIILRNQVQLHFCGHSIAVLYSSARFAQHNHTALLRRRLDSLQACRGFAQ